MARTKSAAGLGIVAEAAPEQFAQNTDTPQETSPTPDMTEAEAATLAQEGEAVLKQMGNILPDPGDIEASAPDVSDTVISFVDIFGQTQEQEKPPQEPEQQPPEAEQDAPPTQEVESSEKTDAEKTSVQEPEQTTPPAQAPDKSEAARENAKKGRSKAATKADKSPDKPKAEKPKPEKRGTAAKEAEAPAKEKIPAQESKQLPEPKEAPRKGEPEQIFFLICPSFTPSKIIPLGFGTMKKCGLWWRASRTRALRNPPLSGPVRTAGMKSYPATAARKPAN